MSQQQLDQLYQDQQLFLQNVTVPRFLDKLASRGYAVKTEEELASVLKLADSMVAYGCRPQQKPTVEKFASEIATNATEERFATAQVILSNRELHKIAKNIAAYEAVNAQLLDEIEKEAATATEQPAVAS